MKNTCFFRVLKDIKKLLNVFYLKWSELFLQCCQEVEENIRPLWKRKILAMKKKSSLFTKLNHLFLYQEFLLLKLVSNRYLSHCSYFDIYIPPKILCRIKSKNEDKIRRAWLPLCVYPSLKTSYLIQTLVTQPHVFTKWQPTMRVTRRIVLTLLTKRSTILAVFKIKFGRF